jgi:hypothetical protein
VLELKYNIKKSPSNVDLSNWASALMSVKNFTRADSLFGIYVQKYPEQAYGYAMRIKANEAQDSSDYRLGIAVPHWENMITFASKDTAKYKGQLLNSLYKLVVYNVNIKKDKAKGIEYLRQYVAADPSNLEAQKQLQNLEKAPQQRPAPNAPAPRQPAARPATGGTKPANGAVKPKTEIPVTKKPATVKKK